MTKLFRWTPNILNSGSQAFFASFSIQISVVMSFCVNIYCPAASKNMSVYYNLVQVYTQDTMFVAHYLILMNLYEGSVSDVLHYCTVPLHNTLDPPLYALSWK